MSGLVPLRMDNLDVPEYYQELHDPGDAQIITPPSPSSSRESYISLPPGSGPLLASPHAPRSALGMISSYPRSHPSSTKPDRERREKEGTHALRKRPPPPAPGALGILDSSNPQSPYLMAPGSDEYLPAALDTSMKEKKRFLWGSIAKEKEPEKEEERPRGRDPEREWESERERTEEGGYELTRMIGHSTASSVENMSLELEICERASANEINAIEAARALRTEFKFGDTTTQLSAARLWAIMLRNCSEIFMTQCMGKIFLETLEYVLTSSTTNPVVKDRIMEGLAAASYAQQIIGPRGDMEGFRGLWRKLKRPDQPDEGVPFDTGDEMPYPRRGPAVVEDIRRLFHECTIGQGNAALLSETLALAKPEDLTKKEIIKEFYSKCCASQQLISAQIPLASAGARRSRIERNQLAKEIADSHLVSSGNTLKKLTLEELLLAALLTANEHLLEALSVHRSMEMMAALSDASFHDGHLSNFGSISSRSPSPTSSVPSSHSGNRNDTFITISPRGSPPPPNLPPTEGVAMSRSSARHSLRHTSGSHASEWQPPLSAQNPSAAGEYQTMPQTSRSGPSSPPFMQPSSSYPGPPTTDTNRLLDWPYSRFAWETVMPDMNLDDRPSDSHDDRFPPAAGPSPATDREQWSVLKRHVSDSLLDPRQLTAVSMTPSKSNLHFAPDLDSQVLCGRERRMSENEETPQSLVALSDHQQVFTEAKSVVVNETVDPVECVEHAEAAEDRTQPAPTKLPEPLSFTIDLFPLETMVDQIPEHDPQPRCHFIDLHPLHELLPAIPDISPHAEAVVVDLYSADDDPPAEGEP